MPRLTVEVVIKGSRGIYLTKRSIEPCKGEWHIPGGTVHYGESAVDAVKRVADWELGIAVNNPEFIGYIEYPSHYNNGLGSPVGLVFVVTDFDGTPELNEEAAEADWFTVVPENMHGDQDSYLVSQDLLSPREN